MITIETLNPQEEGENLEQGAYQEIPNLPEILSLYIYPEHQGQGVGSALYEAIMAKALIVIFG
jgi:GNAT superfamily N-acetyltransferase